MISKLPDEQWGLIGMKARDIRDVTVAILQEAVARMMTFEWHKEVAKLPTEERNEAKMLLAECQAARLALENAELADIAEKLKHNEEALENSRKELKNALEMLGNVKVVITGLRSLLSVVSKIVML